MLGYFLLERKVTHMAEKHLITVDIYDTFAFNGTLRFWFPNTVNQFIFIEHVARLFRLIQYKLLILN